MLGHLTKVEHIGIAVNHLQEAGELYSSLLGASPYKLEEVESEGVKTLFFKVGESKLELLEATISDSPITNFLSKRGEGVHHIAFAVEDIRVEMQRLQDAGFRILSDEPKKGADNKLVCFVHPKTTNGVLIELCQEIQ